MSNKKIKIDCHLVAIGTDSAKIKVAGDLNVPDPEPATGKKIIQEAIGDGTQDESITEDS